MRRVLARGAVVAVATAAATAAGSGPAQAHIVATRLGDFYAGGLHPLAGLEDPVLWLALGLLAGQQDVRCARWVVPAFPLALAAGLTGARLLGLGPVAPALDAGVLDATAMVLVGGLLASGLRLGAPLLAGVAILLGLLRGAANASGIGAGTDAGLFVAGLVLAGYALVTVLAAVSAAAHRAGWGWQRIAARACGSWIVAVGLMLGGYSLAFR